jgi:hypothetical protein
MIKIGKKMSNQNIDIIAVNFLDEDKLKSFLDFYNFLQNNKLKKAKTGRTSIGSWSINYKNKKIGHFRFYENSWSIDYFDLFDHNKWFEKCEKYLTVELKDFILTNINTTSSCCIKGVCHSVENKTILGKMFDSRVCACRPVKLINPDGMTLEYAKELVLIGKNIVAEMTKEI